LEKPTSRKESPPPGRNFANCCRLAKISSMGASAPPKTMLRFFNVGAEVEEAVASPTTLSRGSTPRGVIKGKLMRPRSMFQPAGVISTFALAAAPFSS
jgi:hypothetical protein